MTIMSYIFGEIIKRRSCREQDNNLQTSYGAFKEAIAKLESTLHNEGPLSYL